MGRVGNPNMVRGAPSVNPHGRTKESLSLGREVVAAIQEAFHEGGGKLWLLDMMQNDPRTFAALIAKVIPQDISHDVTHTIVDLSAAMQDANARLTAAGIEPPGQLLEHEPTENTKRTGKGSSPNNRRHKAKSLK